MRHAFAALMVVTGLAGMRAAAQDAASTAAGMGAAYLAVRQQLAPLPVLTGRVLTAELASLRGCEVELLGCVTGRACAGAPSGQEAANRVLMLELADGVAVTVQAGPDVDGLRIGEWVCVIAAVPAAATNLGELTVTAWVREWDLPQDQRLQRPSVPDTADLEEPPSELPTQPVRVRPVIRLPEAPTAPEPSQTPPQPTDQVKVWKAWVLQHNPGLTDQQGTSIVRWVLQYSREYAVNHRLVFAVIKWESDFHPECRSHAGAIGLMQLMPGTARWLGVNPWNVQQNIKGGVQYLAEQLADYRDRSNREQCMLALAAYNAGPNAVKRAGGVPPIAETQRYVKRVTETFCELHQAGFP